MARTPQGEARFKETMAKRKESRKKPIHDTTLEAVTPTIIYSEYFDFKDMQKKLFTNTTAENWAKELYDYVQHPDCLKATEYILTKGIAYETFMQLCEKYEILAEAYKAARYIVGVRREKGALKNELNAGMVHISQSIYDPEWKANAEWKAKLAQDNAANKGNVQVLIERYAPTAIVPEKISNNKEDQ
jgi:hypothetical protein